MAKTLTCRDAISMLAIRYPSIQTQNFAARLCDEVLSRMWNRYAWKERVVELPPVAIVANEQWYGAPLAAVPTDFDALHTAKILSAYGAVLPLSVSKGANDNSRMDVPEVLTYDKARQAFRLTPIPNLNAPYWWFTGEYFKTLTKVTSDTLNSYTLPWDDKYFHVFRSGLIWLVKRDIQPSSLRDIMEARDEFLALLEDMAIQEGVIEGNVFVAPESLSLGG